MPTLECPVTVGSKDYDWQSTTGYVLEARYLNSLGLNDSLHAKCDCSGIPTGATVTQVEWGCAQNSYIASRGVKIYTVAIRDSIGVIKANSTGNVFTAYGGTPAIHWDTMPSTFNQWVNVGGDTWMSLSVPDPGGTNDRQMYILSYEYAQLGFDCEPRIRVTYTEAADSKPVSRVMMIGL